MTNLELRQMLFTQPDGAPIFLRIIRQSEDDPDAVTTTLQPLDAIFIERSPDSCEIHLPVDGDSQ
jgi:hypothetical protein